MVTDEHWAAYRAWRIKLAEEAEAAQPSVIISPAPPTAIAGLAVASVAIICTPTCICRHHSTPRPHGLLGRLRAIFDRPLD
jgi:hypothetical protein